MDGVTVTSGDVLYGVESSFTRFGFNVTSSMLFTRTVITPTSTTLGLPDGTTRDLTTQSNVYIYETGTYTANVQTSDTFAYLSNVVTGTVSSVIQPSLKFENLGTSLASTVSGVNLVNESGYTAPTYDSTNNAIQTAASSSLLCDFSSVRTNTTSDLAVCF